ncbi:MAG: SDR family oxidoreductase [Anaerolineae bacterium]|nr:MAG: SDR family oxidoreductase [Anaerolineae bacterium]
MIVLTGAGGKTGRAVLKEFAAKSLNVRALVFRREQSDEMLDLGARETAWGDMRDPRFMHIALEGARAVYHICPNVHPEEFAIGRNLIEAAKNHSVDLFAYHSVLHPQTEKMAHHWQKLRVEELLFESGLAHIILQPAPYMQNLLAYWKQILHEGIYSVPYSPAARISMVDLADVAEAAAILVSSNRHMGGIFEIVGTRALSQMDVAAIISQQLEIDISVEQISLDAWRQKAQKLGLGDYEIKALLGMFQYYDQYGLVGNNRILSWLLGREPTQLSHFVNQLLGNQP